jgi:hypothetical protein
MSDEKNEAEPSGASGGYAVGDCLAFYCGLGLSNRWEIHKVTKITQSGRLTCGPYTLNPDLSVRGSSGYSGPHRAEPVTKEIVLEVRRRRALEYLKGFDWSKLDADRLEAVVAVTRQA